mmetsp:Transcript_74110/g.229079  ORF Transcript_74110/g.229079 Transcript_74110/m.229079 type:complete len:302 (-) Transcript_74110:289-1194(-)
MVRIPKDVGQASTPDLGIHVQAVECSHSYGQGYAVLVSLQSDAKPCLVQWEAAATYPFIPPKIRFVSKVSHPFVSDEDGSIDLDILGSEWSPALTLRTVLVAVQAVLTEPESWISEAGCILNPDWQGGSLSTPQQHLPRLFAMLLGAAQPAIAALVGGSLDQDSEAWCSWHFLAALHSLLRAHPLAYRGSSEEWYSFLQLLVPVHSRVRRLATPVTKDQRHWLLAAKVLLSEYFCFDGLRVLLRARLLGYDLGSLRRVMRVWEVIQPLISDIHVGQLFPQAEAREVEALMVSPMGVCMHPS